MKYFDKEKLARTFRLIAALIIGNLLGKLLSIPMSGWITITTTVILFDQSTVGGTLQRSSLRFLGTLTSVIISILVILFFPHNEIILWGVFLLTATFYAICFMNTKKSYIGILGIVTMAMLLFNDIHIEYATYRILDITIGILVAIASMLFILPELAFNKAKSLINSSIADLNKLILLFINNNFDLANIRTRIVNVENSLFANITNFTKALEEANYEKIASKTQLKLFNECFLHVRRIYRLSIIILFYQINSGLPKDQAFINILKDITQLLSKLSILENKNSTYDDGLVVILLQRLEEIIVNSPSLPDTLGHILTELKLLANDILSINNSIQNR